MDPIDFEVQLGSIGLNAVQGLAAGAAEVYARLDKLAKDEMARSSSATDEAAALAGLAVLPPPVAVDPSSTPASTRVDVVDAGVASAVNGPQSERLSNMALSYSRLGAELAESWANSVAASAEQRREHERSPIYQATEDYVRALTTNPNPNQFPNLHTVIATIAIGSGLTTFIVAPTDSSSTSSAAISYNVAQDATQQITQLIPDPRSVDMGIIGGIWATAAAFQAAWLTVGRTDPSEKRTVDMQFARAYAGQLVAQCADPEYTNYLTTLVTTNLDQAHDAPPEQIKQWVAMMKVGMLLSALALFGQMQGKDAPSGADIVSLLNSETPLGADDPRAPLINAIRSHLSEITDPDVRASVLLNIMNFLDSRRSTASLTDPAAILLGIFGGDDTVTARRQAQAA